MSREHFRNLGSPKKDPAMTSQVLEVLEILWRRAPKFWNPILRTDAIAVAQTIRIIYFKAYIQMKRFSFLFLFLLLALSVSGQALRLGDAYTSGMVLQRDKPILIQGHTQAGRTVSVRFAGQRVSVKADENGRFSAELKPLRADARPQTLTVVSGKEKLELTDVLVGEVWLCGGQSNMEFNMGERWRSGSTNKVDVPRHGPDVMLDELNAIRIAAAAGREARPLVRALVVEKELRTDTLPTLGWQHITPETVDPISAIAYFFATMMADSLKVPVGVIVSCWGGTDIGGWQRGGVRFERMIRPIAPMAMRGFLWYQGEANLIAHDTRHYGAMQARLIEDWRTTFGDHDLPFYYVQLAPYEYSARKSDRWAHTWQELPLFRDVQDSLQFSLPRTGMAAISDLCDNLRDIHPTYKWEVARRLLLLTLHYDFGRTDIVCQGPRVTDIAYGEGTVTVSFDQPLRTTDGKAPACFKAAEDRGNFLDVRDVRIEGNTVVFRTHERVRRPAHVRYAWDESAITNLCNLVGLPALPFNR